MLCPSHSLSFFLIVPLVCDRFKSISTWSKICCVSKDDLEFLITISSVYSGAVDKATTPSFYSGAIDNATMPRFCSGAVDKCHHTQVL